MKSGGPWNLRGLRPEAREAARDAARQSGMSVGEWLNDVIRPEDEDYGERARYADDDDDRGIRPARPLSRLRARIGLHAAPREIRAAGRASRNRDAAKVTNRPRASGRSGPQPSPHPRSRARRVACPRRGAADRPRGRARIREEARQAARQEAREAARAEEIRQSRAPGPILAKFTPVSTSSRINSSVWRVPKPRA